MADSHEYVQYYKQGLEYYAGGHYEQSLTGLKKAIILQPDFPDAYFLIAKIYDELERTEDALSLYEKLLELLPNDLEVRSAYGRALLKTGEEKKGVKVLKKALKMNAKDPRARMELARFYWKQNRLKPLLSIVEAGIKALPQYAPFYCLAGDVLRKQKKYEKAQDYFDQCLELDADYEPAKRGLNTVIRAMEQTEEERGERSPEEEARAELVEAAGLFSTGKYDLAIVRLLDLKNRPGVEREAAMLLGLAFARKGLFKRARDVFLSFIKEHNPDLLVLYNLGLASNRMGRYEEAVQFLSEALSRDGEYEEALIEMGVAKLMTGDHAAARDYFVRALKINRENPRTYAYLAWLAFDHGDKTKTTDFLKRAKDRDPACPEISLVLGALAVQNEKYEEAEKHLLRCLETAPDHFEAHKLLGQVKTELQDLEGAAESYRAASTLNPGDPEITRILGGIAGAAQ
jgi:tetratricopeptide (TPR) repeat protein